MLFQVEDNTTLKMTMEGSNKHFLKNSEPLLLAKWDVEDRGAGTFHEFDGGSFAGAVFNLSTTIVGAGIMALPATLKVLGLVPGLVMIVLAALLTNTSIELLVRFSRAVGASSYGAVMGDSFGCWGRRLLQICIIINNIGALIVYMIIIGDVLSGTSVGGEHHYGVLEGWFGTHWWNGRFFVLLVTTLCVFAPLASFKRIVVFVVITAGISIVKLVGGQFTGATAAVCFEFIFPAAITLRDPHSIAKKWDKILAVIMIVLAVVSNVVAVYSDTYKMFHKESAPTA
ncbi:hypothetical protein PR202_gb17205 [Eleusine coracana subsp. coracana]|uniref:Amino acid transporter transmembrane domain-containing protein n=1 Tax=Eleusine coracana subsp. coracana TaxID=191504 RepID=A0AAV5F3N5_ELECO|nr:hypothetical protein PR202_gb17205 [Eleusine coracana subsp. coracana]